MDMEAKLAIADFFDVVKAMVLRQFPPRFAAGM